MNKEILIRNIEKAAEFNEERVTSACINAGVGQSFVSDIRRGRMPSVARLAQLAAYLGVTTSALLAESDIELAAPSNYVMGVGVFHNWSEILEYRDAVFQELYKQIPGSMGMDSFNAEKNLIAALQIAMFYDFNEPKLVRWFNDCVTNVDIKPRPSEVHDGVEYKWADVEIQFTPAFKELMVRHNVEETLNPRPLIVSFKDGLDDFIKRQTEAIARSNEPVQEISELNLDEYEMIVNYRKLDPRGQKAVLDTIKREQEYASEKPAPKYSPVAARGGGVGEVETSKVDAVVEDFVEAPIDDTL